MNFKSPPSRFGVTIPTEVSDVAQRKAVWKRVALMAAGSVAIWVAAVGGLVRYLSRWLDHGRVGDVSTAADSLGLPLGSIALLLAAVLLLANIVVAVVSRR